MPQLVEIRQRTSRIFRFKTPWEYVVPDGHEVLGMAVLVDPGPKYQPPTGGDRWGWRDSVYPGTLVVRLDGKEDVASQQNTMFSAFVLSLMDVSWRLSHVENEYFSGVPRLNKLFEYLETSLHAAPTAAGIDALKQALDAATMARDQYITTLMEPGTMKIPFQARAGRKIIVEHRGEMLCGGGLPDLVDEPLAVELYAYQSVKVDMLKLPAGEKKAVEEMVKGGSVVLASEHTAPGILTPEE